MAKNFSNWTLAFVELQKMFGMEVYHISDVLHDYFIREEVKSLVLQTHLHPQGKIHPPLVSTH